jgi:hypothetical protein
VDATSGVFGITGGGDTVAGTLDINTVGTPTVNNTYNVIKQRHVCDRYVLDRRRYLQRDLHNDGRHR